MLRYAGGKYISICDFCGKEIEYQHKVCESCAEAKKKELGITDKVIETIKATADNIYTEYEGEDLPEGTIIFHVGYFGIIHPFLSEDGAIEVDPIVYYGKAFLESDWRKFWEK